MRDPYEVLGLSPGVPDEEVKRAFRRLAKQLHPDLHPNDPSADLRLREVIGAYQALSGSQAQAQYDEPGRAEGRRGFQAKATAIVVFLFTVGSVSVGALWQELSDGRVPPREGPARPPPVEGAAPPIPGPAAQRETMSATGGPLPAEPAAPSDGSSSRDESASGEPTQQGSSVARRGIEDSAKPSATALPETTTATRGPLPAETAAPSDRSPSGDKPVSRQSPQQMSGESVARNGVEDGRSSAEPLSASGERSADPAMNAAAGGQAASAQARPAQPPVSPRVSSSVSPGSVRDLTWVAWRNARFGFTLAYPSDIFVADPEQATDGAAFRSRDGRARYMVSAGMNRNGATLAAHRRSLMEGPYKRAAFDYTPRRAYWFVLSGVLGEEIFYERVTFSCDRRMVHAWKLVYPLAERALYDRIVEEVHRRYSHSNGAGARCGEIDQQASRASRPDTPEASTP
jgi:curved DNA-binding protein CbpA